MPLKNGLSAVPHRVLQDHPPDRKPLGEGREHVWLVKLVQHVGADYPGQPRHPVGSKDDSGDPYVLQHVHDPGPAPRRVHVLRREEAADVAPTKVQHDPHDGQRQQEVRGADPYVRGEGGDVVKYGVLLDRRDYAYRDGEGPYEQDSYKGQAHGQDEPLLDQIVDRGLASGGESKVAPEHLADPLQVLHVDRLVEAVLAPQGCLFLLRDRESLLHGHPGQVGGYVVARRGLEYRERGSPI